MLRPAHAVVLVLASALAAGTPLACRRSGGEAPRARGTPTAIDPAATGTLTGTVRLAGPLPPVHRIRVTSDAACEAAHPDGMEVGTVAVHDGAVAGALVWIASGLETFVFPVPTEPVVIDQRGCRFVPEVAGVRAGQPIEFRNGDPTLHNVLGKPTGSAGWNFGLGTQGATRTVTIDRAEVPVPLACNVHSWMQAWLGVVDHPFFAVTGADGRFTFRGVPAGRHAIAVWHPRLGRREASALVSAGGETTVVLDLG